MRFMIHSCNERLKYVEDKLIPSMVRQGILREDIVLFNDDLKEGCLKAWVRSLKLLENEQEGYWHLQDDIEISKDFYERIKDIGDFNFIVNGFVCKQHNLENYEKIGFQYPKEWWASLQCVYIPSKYVRSFLEWFLDGVVKGGKFNNYLVKNRHADFFFYRSVIEKFPQDYMLNLVPCLVNHIDYKLGGSVITPEKRYLREAYYWEEKK